jgi:cytoskeletal protein CcmA (bactofilin family)
VQNSGNNKIKWKRSNLMPLFGKKKQEDKSPRPQTALSPKETTYFGKNLKIKGRVSGNGNIIILGALDGEFNLKGRVKIAQPAKAWWPMSGSIWIKQLELKGRSIRPAYP